MMKNKIFLYSLIIVLFYSCQSTRSITSDSIYLYRENSVVNRPYEIMEETYWIKEDGNIDSLAVTSPTAIKKLETLLNNSKKERFKQRRPFIYLHTYYAIILEYQNQVDTLYLNEELNGGYLTRNKIVFKNTKDEIYKFFEERNFLTELTIYLRNREEQP